MAVSATETRPEPPSAAAKHYVLAAICALGALGIMVTALFLAQQEEGEAGGETAATRLSDVDKFGRPTNPDAPAGEGDPRAATDAGGCGQLDPDHPPEVEFVLEGGKMKVGELKQGVKVERTVTFRNSGTGPLCVAKVSTGCGCLKAKLVGEKKRFEPGEEGKVAVVIDTTGRVGTIRKQVTLTTNALTSPLKSFRVEMRISAGLIAEPRYLQFASVGPDTKVTRYLILRSPKDDPAWKVTNVEGIRDIPGRGKTTFEWLAEEVDDPRYRKFKVRITHPGYSEPGPVRDILHVTTTHPDRPKIEVSAQINVVPRIRSHARVVSLGFVRPGTPRGPMKARIQPGKPGLPPFTLTKVEVLPKDGHEVPAGGLGFVAKIGKDDKGWFVDVSYDGKSRKPGLIEGVLVVHTDDEVQPEVRVPLRATIRRSR